MQPGGFIMKIEVVNQMLFTSKTNGKLYPERYDDIPIMRDGAKPRTMMIIRNIAPPVPGEVWRIGFEIHATNDELTARNHECYFTTEVRIGESTNHDRDGLRFLRANGSHNITPRGHHHLVSRCKDWQWSKEDLLKMPKEPVIKMMCWSGSDASLGERLKIDRGRGFLQLTRFVP